MSKATEKVREKVTEELVGMFGDMGMNPTVIKIYLSVFFAEGPVGLSEISKDTGYSLSTISNTMEIIERMFDVRSFKKPKSKKIYYECHYDIYEIIRKRLLMVQNGFFENSIRMLAESQRELDGDQSPEAAEYRKTISKQIGRASCRERV